MDEYCSWVTLEHDYYGLGITEDGKQVICVLAGERENTGVLIYVPEYDVELLNSALSQMVQAHGNQLDKSGAPYALHPYRVGQNVCFAGGDLSDLVVALLHDVVEDSNIPLLEIRYNFGDRVACAVDALTHRKGESNHDYYRRILQDEIALSVKFHDIADNMDERRLSMLPAEMATRLRAKYEHALDFLHSEDQPKLVSNSFTDSIEKS